VSFRNRLASFFVLIVLVPMVAVAFILFSLLSDNENGKADARLAAQTQVAINVYKQRAGAADRALVRLQEADRGFARGLTTGDPEILQRAAERLVRRRKATRVTVERRTTTVVDVGSPDAVAPATRDLRAPAGGSLGRLKVSTTSANVLARSIGQTVDVPVIVSVDGKVLASTLSSGSPRTLPRVGTLKLGGRDYRVASFDAPGFTFPIRVSLLTPRSDTATAIAHRRLLAAAVLLAFFILAFAFAVVVSRSLQLQIGRFLTAARRIGSGDFTARVPTAGRDEFSALGEEFNKMSSELEERLEELRGERVRLEESLRRIGDTFASNLDRDALLEIVVHSAIDAVGGEGGRATARSEPGAPLVERVRAGDVEELKDALAAVEAQVLATGSPGEATVGDASALAHPMREADAGSQPLGLVSVARRGHPFSATERDLFHYLTGQAAVSIENVGLHETVQRQARTDDLTGLANHRRFQEALASELERSKRFGHSVSLLMLDIDDFKEVNDSYGHQQGDLVLREVARILRESSREIDEPARYGGEELAVVLPETSLEGAYNLAERVRARIEALEFDTPEGSDSLSVTASLGVAAIEPGAGDGRALVAAADAALYDAKRSGKNKTMRAQ
jgi:diguanylate cyclase (GGDEF)-like protein